MPFLQLRTPVYGMRLPIFRVSLPKKHLHRYTQSCLSKSIQVDNDNLTAIHTGKSYRKKVKQPGLLSHHFPWFDLKETWLFRGVCSSHPDVGREENTDEPPGGPVAFSSDWLQVITNKMRGEATQRLLGKFLEKR